MFNKYYLVHDRPVNITARNRLNFIFATNERMTFPLCFLLKSKMIQLRRLICSKMIFINLKRLVLKSLRQSNLSHSH